MKRIFCALLACAACLPLLGRPARAAGETVVRVGLAYGASALAAPQLQNVDGAGYDIGTMDGLSFLADTTVQSTQLTIVSAGGGLAVRDTASGHTLYQTDGDTLAISPRGELTWFNKYKYRGDFVYQLADGKVSVINYVGLEDYIKGVVPYEMSASWPAEALKAQAVCARSYADGQMGKHKADGFDLCATTHCEVYQGANRATEHSDQAVDQTAGQYLRYRGEKVVGYYFSSDGGATEDAVNVWGGDYPYLTGVPDPYEDSEKAGSNGVWTVTLTAAQVGDKLRAAGHSIGTVASMQVSKRTPMGNVNEVTVTDTAGKQVKISRAACRSVFGLNSIRYTIGAGGTSPTRPGVPTSTAAGGAVSGLTGGSGYIISADGQARLVDLTGRTVLTAAGEQTIPSSVQQTGSADMTADAPVTAASFTFAGAGWGHSVGMSQYGAKAMAEQGFSYDRILQYYFTGVTVG